MTRADQIPLHAAPASAEIAERFLGLAGRVDSGEETGAVELGQLSGIATIRLDAGTGLHGDERRCDHRAADTERAKLALKNVSGGARFVATFHGSRRLTEQAAGETADRLEVVSLGPFQAIGTAGQEDC
jgi:hypothetical protein